MDKALYYLSRFRTFTHLLKVGRAVKWSITVGSERPDKFTAIDLCKINLTIPQETLQAVRLHKKNRSIAIIRTRHSFLYLREYVRAQRR